MTIVTMSVVTLNLKISTWNNLHLIVNNADEANMYKP